MGIFNRGKDVATVVDSAGGLAEKIGDAFDKNFTTKEEMQQAKNELLVEAYKQTLEVEKLRSNIILAEAGGSWMQRNWRPLLMLSFAFIIICTWFVFPIINIFTKDTDLSMLIKSLQDATQFWDVVSLGLGGYIIGRSAEKITDSIGKNMDVSIGRKGAK